MHVFSMKLNTWSSKVISWAGSGLDGDNQVKMNGFITSLKNYILCGVETNEKDDTHH